MLALPGNEDVRSINVVVGETNRGKSSRVNALLATPNLSPVDAEVATATYLVFRHGEQWSGRACYAGSMSPVPFERSEIVNWVSAAHELPEGMLPPRYVEVEAPIPLLERLYGFERLAVVHRARGHSQRETQQGPRGQRAASGHLPRGDWYDNTESAMFFASG